MMAASSRNQRPCFPLMLLVLNGGQGSLHVETGATRHSAALRVRHSSFRPRSNVFVCCLFIFLSARIVAKQAGSYMYRRALSLGLLRQISLWLRLHFVHSRSCRAGQAQDDVKATISPRMPGVGTSTATSEDRLSVTEIVAISGRPPHRPSVRDLPFLAPPLLGCVSDGGMIF
ncbi:hypothetical protein V8E53_001731 [Lactarius tabidus]